MTPSNSDPHASPLFPSLVNLTGTNVDFEVGHPTLAGSALELALKQRAKAKGTRIQKLTIQACHVLPSCMDKWSQYVGEVQWDCNSVVYCDLTGLSDDE